MNKVIPSKERVFMSLVGPSGCGKSRLIFQMLQNGTFQPKFDKIFYFYQHHQLLYDEMRLKIDNIEFVKGIDFQLIDELPADGTQYLLIFDDSGREISQSKAFEDIAKGGRHRGFNVIYVKHNLFHKSTLGRDIEIQNTHIVLFKSPRDVNQIKKLGEQLGKGSNLVLWYNDATSKPFGHLLIDIHPRTNDKLRYCTDCGTFPSKFYLESSQARITVLEDDHTERVYSQVIPFFYGQISTNLSPQLLKRVHSLPLRVYKKSHPRSIRSNKGRSGKFEKSYQKTVAKTSKFKRKKTTSLFQKRFILD